MSDSRSRITGDYRSRPSSEQLVDLHIYVVPPDIWRQKHNDVLNTDVNETISAGFIRVHPESKVFTLRDDIEQQLGLDLTPKDYVFMKCVGRSLTRVKPKQEYQLKIKNFLPPLAYLPEVYLLEVSPNERHLYGLSSGEGSSRAQTRTGETPLSHGYRNRYSGEDLDRYNSRERLNFENEKIRNNSYNQGVTGKSAGSASTYKLTPVDPQRAQLKSRSSHRTGLSVDTVGTSRDPGTRRQQLKSASGRTQSSQGEPRQHGVLLEEPGRGPSINLSHSPRFSVKPATPPNTDTPRSHQPDSSALPPISNHARSPPPQHRQTTPPQQYSPNGRSNGHQGHGRPREAEHSYSSEPNSHPPLSASPPPSSDQPHGHQRRAYPDRKERRPRRANSPNDAYAGDNYDNRGNRTYRANAGRQEEDARARQKEEENDRRRDEEETRRRQREEERRRQEDQLRQWEEERRDTQKRLEEEARDRAQDEEMERQRLLADQEMFDLLDEARRQEELQQRQRQQEEDAMRRREDEEAYRRRQQEEEAYRRRQEEEEALQRQQEEADLKRIEEQRQRLQDDELLKADADEHTAEELSRFPSPPPIRTTSPDQEMSEEDKSRKKAEKERLQSEVEKAREQRRAVERQREELVKRAKALQTKTQNRRNHARDVWKKRYFEEKKKTAPLEDQSNRLRQEVDQIHRKLMSTLEGPKDQRGSKHGPPSEKNNYKIQSTRLQHEIEDLKRRVENSKMKLTAEMKLRNQAETELRALRAELTQKKINLTLSRSQQLATLSTSSDMAYMTPRTMISPRS